MELKVIFLMCSLFLNNSCAVILFRSSEFKGESWSTKISYENEDCVTVPQEWQNEASSIITQGICVELYAHTNCNENGPKIVIGETDFHHVDLSQGKFHKRIKSLKVCSQYIDDNIEDEYHLANKREVFRRTSNRNKRQIDKSMDGDLIESGSGSGETGCSDDDDCVPSVRPVHSTSTTVAPATKVPTNSTKSSHDVENPINEKEDIFTWQKIVLFAACAFLLTLFIVTLTILCICKCRKRSFCCSKIYNVSENL